MNEKPTEAELGGMTVNERLYAVGLMDELASAAYARDREKMIEILGHCALPKEQCEETTDTMLKNPKMYGF